MQYLIINKINEMKNMILGIAVLTIIFAACNNSASDKKESNTVQPTATPADTTAKHVTAVTGPTATISLKEIVDGYLQLKNAFTKDNSAGAATAGTLLETAFKTFDKTALTVGQKKIFEDVEDDAREHAEHIGKNGGNIVHQREHFEMLSKDMYDLVKAFGGGQVLYKDFCPMYNNNKGAFWLSETKEIKNPYLGKAMPTCGTMKEEIK